jgi:hypothetical protein
MPFERFGNIIVGSTQCGNLGCELEPQVLAVWRSSELRAGRVNNRTEVHTAVHPLPGGLAPIMSVKIKNAVGVMLMAPS